MHLLNELKDHWEPLIPDREIVILFTGKDIQGKDLNLFPIDTIGQANPTVPYDFDPNADWDLESNTILAIDNPYQESYAVAQQISQGPYSASAFQKEILVNHEIGHLFGAIHVRAGESCDIWFLDSCISGHEITIMGPTGSPSIDEFSDGTRPPFSSEAPNDPSFANNEQIIIDNAQQILMGCQTPSNMGQNDWIIESDCTMLFTDIASSNVIIKNNSLLTIPNGISLDVDFTQNNISIEFGSGILIKTGGKIK